MPELCFFILRVSMWVWSQRTKISVHWECNQGSQSYTEAVSHRGSGHGKLPLSVFSLWQERQEYFSSNHFNVLQTPASIYGLGIKDW